MSRKSRSLLNAVWLRLGAAALAGTLLVSPSRASRDDAESFVEACLQRGYAILSDKSLSEEDRRVQFHNFMLVVGDMDHISRFTLGMYVTHASAADLKQFQAAFAEHDIVVYSAWLSKYKGLNFVVTGSSKRSSDETIVRADFSNPADPNGPHSEVDFQVGRRADGRLALTDIRVDGIWLAVSERGEFTGFLDAHRGSVAELTHHIQSVARQIFSGSNQNRL